MKNILVKTNSHKKEFLSFAKTIYKNIPFYRNTDDIVSFLINKKTEFHKHATILPFITTKNAQTIARFVLINDKKWSECTQVAFFEAIKGLNNSLIDNIIDLAKKHFPYSTKICFGLNGHLNHGAGILLNKFNETAVFGLPYTPDYYPNYFKNLTKKTIASFRFPISDIDSRYKKLSKYLKNNDIKVRTMNMKELKKESELYTDLNNICFQKHIYWTNRNYKEDYELFEPFRHMLKSENLIFAEYKGKIAGFLLWFPDYNQLVRNNKQELKTDNWWSKHVLKYKFFKKIDTFRLTEIAVVPKFQKKRIELALFLKLLEMIKEYNYKFCEGGFIFEENKDSINMSLKYIERLFGYKAEIYRKYAVFEKDINTI